MWMSPNDKIMAESDNQLGSDFEYQNKGGGKNFEK